jgi:serine/threonine-protein kinase
VKLDVPTLARLSPLMDEALELDDAQLAAWFTDIGANNADLIPALRELLSKKASVQTSDILQRGPEFTAPGGPTHLSEFKADHTVGPYRLLRELGRGGMGEVWLAERIDGSLKRQVALKLPHSALPQRQLAERFARERDILGSLVHPNIARLYDAGVTPEGQPYLALEYVEGEMLTTWCDARKLGIKARIALYRQVFAAVEYAHRQLVLHRDIKPTNILVTAAGEVRLLDFGIAKLMTDGQAHETELTQLGGRALSLQYASPEQITGQAIGTASDVYTLGVVLYELLTGTLPYRSKRDSRGALEEAILNLEPVRLSQAEISEPVAEARGMTPKKLAKQLTGELDTIVVKALKKNQLERFGTVEALAQDLGRYLRGDTVLARPDSTWYRTRKFIGRNSLAVGAGALVTVVVLAASAVSIWQARVAREQTKVAQTEAATAKAVQGFLLDLFQANSSLQSDPQKARQMTARELLDRGAARVDEALGNVPVSRLQVMGTLADMYAQLGLEAQAAQLQRRRLELARQTYGERDTRLAEMLLEYVETMQESDRRQEIPKLLDEARAALTAAGGDKLPLWGDVLLSAGHYWKYESLLRAREYADQAVAFFNRGGQSPTGLITAQELAARARVTNDEFEAGASHAMEAINAAQRQGDAAAAWQATPTLTLADAQIGAMAYAKAETVLRDALASSTRLGGEALLETLTAKARLGNLLLILGRSVEGDALHESVRSALRTNDPRHDAQMRSYMAGLLAKQMMDRGRPDQMAPQLQAEVEDLRRTLPRSPLLAHRERVWALSQAALGQFDAARQTLVVADAHWSAYAEGVATPFVNAEFALSRACVAIAAGDPGAALTLLNPAQPAIASVAIERHIERARANLMLGHADGALAAAGAALLALSGLPDGGRPVSFQANALLVRGKALLATRDALGATASLESALALRRANDLPGSLWHEQAALALADAWVARGRPDLAIKLRAEANKLNRVRSLEQPDSKNASKAATHAK